MFDLKTSAAVLALLGTGYYGYSSLDSKFDLYERHIQDQDNMQVLQNHQIQKLKKSLADTHESLKLEKSNRMDQIDMVQAMVEDNKATHVDQGVTDAWVYESDLASQRAGEYQDQFVVYFAWKTSPTCNFKVATKDIYHAEAIYAMYEAYDSPTIIWRNGQILKQWGDKKQVMACKFLADYGFEYSSFVSADTAASIKTLEKDYASLEKKYDALAKVQKTQEAHAADSMAHLAAGQKTTDAEIEHNKTVDADLRSRVASQKAKNAAQDAQLMKLHNAVEKDGTALKNIDTRLGEASKSLA